MMTTRIAITSASSLRTGVAAGTRAVRFKSTSAAPAATVAPDARPNGFAPVLATRFKTAVEIAVSKIFPAGFGWQGASVLAENAGFATDSVGFYTITGFGDLAGVLCGHVAFYAAKKAIVDKSIDMTAELQTGLLLGTAAFGSGFVWQFALNGFQSLALPFAACAVGTGVVCGSVFFSGMRVGRSFYAPHLKHIDAPSYRNLRDDAALSVAIGGATGMFVGTDTSMADNVVRGFVGIEDGASTMAGMMTAGKSTAAGFMATQGAMNTLLPRGRNWLDEDRV